MVQNTKSLKTVHKKILFLDLDGTLMDVSNRLYTVYKKLLEHKNITPILEKGQYWKLKRAKVSEEEIVRKTGLHHGLHQYIQEREKLLEAEEYLQLDTPFAGAIETLRILKDHYTLIIITRRKNAGKTIAQLKRLEILPEVDDILLADKERRSKSEYIQKHFKESIVKKWSAIVGDTEEDIFCGRELGIVTLAVTTGLRNKEILQRYAPDSILDSFCVISAVLRKIEK